MANGDEEARVHLHPFPSLKILYGQLGGQTNLVNLGGTKSQFYVDVPTYVNASYPVNTAEPLKTVKVPFIHTTVDRIVVIWVVVIYSLLLVFFIVLTVGFFLSHQKAKSAEAAKANHVLYDNLNPTSGEDKAVE